MNSRQFLAALTVLANSEAPASQVREVRRSDEAFPRNEKVKAVDGFPPYVKPLATHTKRKRRAAGA